MDEMAQFVAAVKQVEEWIHEGLVSNAYLWMEPNAFGGSWVAAEFPPYNVENPLLAAVYPYTEFTMEQGRMVAILHEPDGACRKAEWDDGR